MKKTYIKPEINLYQFMAKNTLLAGSATFSSGLGNTNSNGGDALSRDMDWDDDDY